MPYFFSDQYDLGMEYSGWVDPRRLRPGGVPRRPASSTAAPEFLAFWVATGAVLAGMNANVWDVTETIAELVRAGLAGRPWTWTALADPSVALEELAAG